MQLQKTEKWLLGLLNTIGKIASILLIILVALICMNVFMRYALNDVSIGLQELEWHLFSVLFLLGMAYAWAHGGHVRVDILYDRLSVRRQKVVDVLGTLLFLMPFCILIFWYGMDYTLNSFALGEGSGDPGGLPYRWIIKAMIPLSAFLLILAALFTLIQQWNQWRRCVDSTKS